MREQKASTRGWGRVPVFRLELRGPAHLPHPLGSPVPVVVTLHNTSAHRVWAAGVLDGSEDGVRYPHYEPAVLLEGRTVSPRRQPEDPLVGPLRPADFRQLEPGEAFDPTGPGYLPLTTFTTFTPRRPGTYLYTLTLSTLSADPEEWLGRFGQGEERATVLGLVARVPRERTVSPPLPIEVR
ncbi:hypothetical protein [Streptomyces iconiensis]|uniref:Uncharacterized protein n=1 Tax=Streptomyces iconiensis TaxID=1384038 RepID=A0ABT6ZQ01_9ACTN|nr:hypothetical protein [Streptomyces iconiensis]MDJ1131135.1 hypothetical protein [Streptomyces iconiensis]